MKKTLLRQNDTAQNGFTIVEVIVTVVIVTLFVMTFFQTYMVMESQRVNVARQSIASDLAYSNLRLITTPDGNWNCSSTVPIKNDPANTNPSLGANARQVITVSGPNGCTGTNNEDFRDGIVKVESKVIFSGGEVVHATYIR